MTHAEFEAELRQQLGTDMVMIPREVLERYRNVLVVKRVMMVDRKPSAGYAASIDAIDTDLAHIAAALDNGTDPETKE